MVAEDPGPARRELGAEAGGGCSCTTGHLLRLMAELAEPVAHRLAKSVVRELQGMREGMQSGDSGLANMWDEICVQVQECESVMWPLYEELMLDLSLQSLRRLDHPTLCALWLQTEGGGEWEKARALGEADDLSCPCDVQETAQYIVRERLLSLAADWSNKRIERYFASGQEMDD